jgi:hypothetical protein
MLYGIFVAELLANIFAGNSTAMLAAIVVVNPAADIFAKDFLAISYNVSCSCCHKYRS